MESSSFKLVDAVLWLLGAFYVFAGHIAIRTVLRWRAIGLGLAAVEAEITKAGHGEPAAKRPFAEAAREAWLLAAAFIILAGGLTLMLRLEAATWLFAISTLGQAFYLTIIAPHYFDLNDPPHPEGRRQTINAFVLYAAATAFVFWAHVMELLMDWEEVAWPLAAGVSGLLAGYAAYVLWQYLWPLGLAQGRARRRG